MQLGDLLYIPSETKLLKFNDVDMDSIDPTETYIGRAPITVMQLKEPINVLVTGKDKKYYKVYYAGETWYVNCQ